MANIQDLSSGKANYNLEQLLLEKTAFSDFFKNHNVSFKAEDGHINLYYKGKLQPPDDELKYSGGNIYYLRSRLGHNRIQDYCINGFAFRTHLDKNSYFASLSWLR